ncbi:MAG: single-stranded-DNA-specific exonuclease RecJ [Ignavibacteriae bacterium]|nr:MAG: single-stranded-DNA-specific exonuclease RecJ [Ignavibacteriota bacterium]
MVKKKWTLKEPPEHNSVLALADSLNISMVLSELLIQRGITNFFEAKKFFRPNLDELHDPYLMDDMEKAATRVINAITNNERICVFGDYDVDGTCSASLMYLFLKELGANVFVYIPNRLTEGYGLSIQGINNVVQEEASLIISVDCGITAVEEIDYANTFGIDTIICDHHQPKEELPNSYAILDPLKPGCEYPFKYLSGAGVAFKLARAIAYRFGNKDMVFQYLDLVALAGAADIVPLINENRILVKTGIEQINSNPRPGIKALIKSARMEPGNLSAGQIVFTLAPRINAVGRLGDANRAVELFNTDSFEEAERLAKVLESENLERRKIDEVTYSHAIEMVESMISGEEDEFGIVLHHDSWHPGVVGIVASRLVEKFYKPSIMLTTIDGVAKGSARSIPGFNIYEAIEECKDLIVQFGGHKAAAGLEIEVDNIPEFRKKFNEILKLKLQAEDITPEIKIDSKISLCEITPKFVRVLEQFAPFGPGNMRPVFQAEDVMVVNTPRIVGTNHFITTFSHNVNDKVFDAIGFNLGKFVVEFEKNNSNLVDIVFTIEKIVKDGRTYPQIRVKDIRIKN